MLFIIKKQTLWVLKIFSILVVKGTMNFSTRIKTKKKSPEKLPINPKYVLNVSIDIPLKTRYAITSRLDSSQYCHSPNRLKKKYQISITPVKTKGRSESLGPANNKSTQRHRKLSSMVLNSNPIKNKNKAQIYRQYKSIDLIGKTVSRKQKAQRLGNLQKCDNVIRNISVLQCLQKDDNDNMIKYTFKSNPTNKTQQGNQRSQNFKLISSSSQLELLNVRQIRQYESLATSRRQHLNLQYIRNIQMQASAKKIQRFWRKYRTKKLIQSYSYEFIKNKQSLCKMSQSTGIAKSQQSKSGFWKKNKEALLVNRHVDRHVGLAIDLDIQQVESEQKNRNKLSRCEQTNSILFQQIKSQDSSDKDIKMSSFKQTSSRERTSDISARLHDFRVQEQQKQRFEKYLQKIKISQQKQPIQSNESEDSENQQLFQGSPGRLAELLKQQTQQFILKQAQENQVYGFQTTTQQRMHKIQLFEQAINKIDYQISQISNSSVSQSPQQNKIIQTLENQRMQKALDWFGQKMQLFFSEQHNLDEQEQEQEEQQSQSDRIQKKNQDRIQKPKQNANIRRRQFTKQMDKIVRMKQNKLESDRSRQHRNQKDSTSNEIKKEQPTEFNPFAPINPFLNEAINTDMDRKQLINKRTKQNQETINPKKRSGQQQLLDSVQKTEQKGVIDQILQKQHKNTLSQRLQKLSIMQQLELCKSLGQQLIVQGVYDLSCLPNFISQLKQAKNKLLSSGVQKSVPQQQTQTQCKDNKQRLEVYQKPQGICTNLESIKDYLENFVSFALQNHQDIIIKNINTQTGPTPQILFQYLRKLDVQQLSANQSVIPLSLFQKHWSHASQQIYFDQKFQDQKMEIDRIRYLKSLTKVYFRSIFDGFNQSLEFSRVFGFLGKPYPWKDVPKFEKNVGQIKEVMRNAYRRISKVSTIYCGLHFSDKKHAIPLQVMRNVEQERMNNLLQFQLAEQQLKWSFYDDQQAETLFQLYLLVQQSLMNEVLTEMHQFL